MRRRLTGLLALAALLALPPAALAQALGTYSWQLAPYCNVVTVNVTQTGATYTLDGYDTQCGGASNRAPLTGMAVPNPNGTIGFGLTIVTSPGGTPVHIDAAINLTTLGGTWQDSLGGTGAFVFTPAGVASGNPRPLAAVALRDGAVTTPKLADGAVTAAKIDPAQVQRRVGGVCPAGQLMTGVSESGSVTCEAVTSGAGGDITGVAAGTGLTGGGATGDVTLAANFAQVQARVAAGCPANETIRAINADGTVLCDVDNDSGGDITAVIAGQGLAGGSLAGNATLNVIFTGTGTASSVARADHTHAAGGVGNTRIGEEAIGNGSESVAVTAIGFRALRNNNVDGQVNTAVGSEALTANTSGTNNAALGFRALASNTDGSRATAIGTSALLFGATNDDSTAVGYRAGAGGGASNVAVGSQALGAFVSTARNTAVGTFSLELATDNNNTAVGAGALDSLTAGSDNVALGEGAGTNLTSGSNNLYVFHGGVATESNTIRIGRNLHERAFLGGVRGVTTGQNNAQAVVIDSLGQLGTVSSSRRTKFDIADLESPVTSALQALRPVQFRYRKAFADGSTPIQYGLIAEEVQEVLPELVATDGEGQPASVKYHVLPALLLADVQRLERARRALADTVDTQHRTIDALSADLAALRAQVEVLMAAALRRR